ncbi:MAG: SAM-dependent methyltransferase [Oscillospiraceae bacterium]|nr:SAM-dependent methyltransferase [Oscillospiraceae bacterium]
MKLPISARLLLCADLIEPPCRPVDVGTDHGYHGIHLLKCAKASHVIAADLRPMPLGSARRNAALFDEADRMTFVLSDGLEKIDADAVDTVICAGMGGDLIVKILQACPWICDEKYRLILQPQSTPQTLRAWLCEHGFGIEEERICLDGDFTYTVMRVRYGRQMRLSPGEQYLTPQLLSTGDALLKVHATRIETALTRTVNGLSNAKKQRPAELAYYQQALEEIKRMKEQL